MTTDWNDLTRRTMRAVQQLGDDYASVCRQRHDALEDLRRLQALIGRLPARWSGVAMTTQELADDLQRVVDAEYRRGETVSTWARDDGCTGPRGEAVHRQVS